MKSVLILFLSLICSLSFAEIPTAESVERASQEKINLLLKTIGQMKAQDLAQSHFSISNLSPSAPTFSGRNCEPPPAACVRNCKSRFSDGSCAAYGPDYCGPRANCAAHCKSRYSDGSCASYAPDFCGPDAVCSPNCRSRYSNGSCAAYGEDMCF